VSAPAEERPTLRPSYRAFSRNGRMHTEVVYIRVPVVPHGYDRCSDACAFCAAVRAVRQPDAS
jgi:hypothetical protein